MGRKIIYVGYRKLVEMISPERVGWSAPPLRDHVVLTLISGVPKDMRVVCHTQDITRRAIGFVVESDEWPDVPDGDMIPELQPEFLRASAMIER